MALLIQRIKNAFKAWLLKFVGFEKGIVDAVGLIADYKMALGYLDSQAPKWLDKHPQMKLLTRVADMCEQAKKFKDGKELAEHALNDVADYLNDEKNLKDGNFADARVVKAIMMQCPRKRK